VSTAVAEIAKYPFSVAIFGQAFVYEMWNSFTDHDAVKANEDLFWRGAPSNYFEIANSAGVIPFDQIFENKSELP